MFAAHPSPWHSHALQRLADGPAEPLVPPSRMEWTPHRGHGPGAELLGTRLHGKRALELGCGPGHNAAHLSHHHGVQATAIDLVGLQIRRARSHYGHIPHLTFSAGHALHYLHAAQEPFDAIYSVFGAIGLVAPELLLPAAADCLTDRGLLAFAAPHPRRRGGTPEPGVSPSRDLLTLPDRSRLPIVRWDLEATAWSHHLHRAGLRQITSQTVSHPGGSRRPTTLLITARKT
ncbi:class I SAM-dependent methyltransferase [Streptomyces reniochalinae]|uniref:Class I SAM-dependent methyltransferase n=1 Tax=Streptomyces reniochalinae TaxID=2250578 RepID=A0A367ECV5_9ACTN|nr:class I SAM-dependent methyltransferase [Streptomyces reniochalinae]RCG15070.1 class I SAM-dependent methyltransferase [Streptomyces reniochalinae]